jgi:hypothetical protein
VVGRWSWWIEVDTGDRPIGWTILAVAVFVLVMAAAVVLVVFVR